MIRLFVYQNNRVTRAEKILQPNKEEKLDFIDALASFFVCRLRNAHVLHSCVIVLHICVIVMIALYSVFHNIDFRPGANRHLPF